jgi:hypothetical protein
MTYEHARRAFGWTPYGEFVGKLARFALNQLYRNHP